MSEFILPKKQSKVPAASSFSSSVPLDHIYETTTKLVKTPADMPIWEKSESYYEYLGFILCVNDAIKGKSNSRGGERVSSNVKAVVEMLLKMDKEIDATPPIQQPQRFGNVAFKTWHTNFHNDVLNLLQSMLPEQLYKSIAEIASYLIDGFGNPTRIDYGTGHEIAFIMFICCLVKIGFLQESDYLAIGCVIFPKYLSLVQKLQKTYRMEPAGSHGVWSLDDYQFVPFIWGSSQLFAHPQIQPAHFLQPTVINDYADDYLFINCIRYINSVKTGPFAEHSNQLWSISGVSSWSKINGGLIKMYKAEVLSKFPVVQHIFFGSLFTLKPVELTSGLMAGKTSLVLPPTRSSSITARTSVDSTASAKSSSVLSSGGSRISEGGEKVSEEGSIGEETLHEEESSEEKLPEEESSQEKLIEEELMGEDESLSSKQSSRSQSDLDAASQQVKEQNSEESSNK